MNSMNFDFYFGCEHVKIYWTFVELVAVFGAIGITACVPFLGATVSLSCGVWNLMDKKKFKKF